MKIKCIILSVSLCFVFLGCDVMKQVGGAYTMTQCKYTYNSLNQLNLGGVDLSKGISLAYLPMITSLLTGQATSLPLNFNLNLDVENPNPSEALLNGLEYILEIDGISFTSGSMSKTLSVPSGGKQVLPLNIGVDLITLIKGESKDAVVSIVKNFIGMGSQKSNVTLQIKPTFVISGYPVVSPVYIPVTFTFGGA